MRIIIVGSNGLVGNHLVRKLNNDHELTLIGRDNFSKVEFYGHYDSFIYLAQSADYKSNFLTQDLLHVNCSLLNNFLGQLRQKVNQVILFSTGSIYQKSDEIINENSAVDYLSSNPYVVSKIMGEKVAQTYINEFNNLTIVRPFFIYGKEQSQQMLFKTILRNVVEGKEIILNEGKGLEFNPIFVEDVVELVSQLLLETHLNGIKFINAFGPEITNLGNIVDVIENNLGIKANRTIKEGPVSSFLATNLGYNFNPKIGINEGIKLFLDN
jgi:UDP-glucose 4-epimerase